MKNISKSDWLSALYVAFYLRPQTYGLPTLSFKSISTSGIRWQCNMKIGGNYFEGTGVSKRKAKQNAAKKACEQFGLKPVEHAKPYRLPDPA